MSKKKDSLKPWLSRPAINRSVTLPLTRPLTQRLSNLNEFHPNELDPYLLFDARDSMIGTLENPTLDLDPSKPDTLNVITATRAGVATYTDVNGNIATASADTVRVDYTQGAELTPTKFQQLEQTGFSLWAHARTSGTANAAISPDGQNNATYVEQNAGQTNAGSIYRFDAAVTGVFTLSVYAKKKEKDFVVLYDSNVGRTYFNLDTGTVGTVASGNTANIEDAGNGWFRCSTTFTASSGAVKAFYVGDNDNSLVVTGGGGIYIYGPQLEEGTTASSFVENTTGSPKFITGATYGPRVPMILVEPSSENLLTATQEVSSWSSADVSVTSNTTTAPDGSQTGDTVTRTAGGGNVRQTKVVTSGTSYTVSIFAKAETDNQIQLDFSNSSMGDGNVEFNTRTGQKVSGSDNYTITELANGWRRYSFTSTCISSGNTGVIIRLENDEPVQLWGFQFEEGSVPTSYIPHISGSTVTRAADDLVISGSAFTDFFNSGGDGTFYAEFITRTITGTNVYVLAGHSSTQRYMYSTSGPNLSGYDGLGGTLYSGAIQETLNRASISYDSNTKTGSFNGSADSTVAGSGDLRDSTRLAIGQSWSSTAQLNGHIKRLIYWPYHSDSL
uniref:Uncharacterized protein n=1 Tax=uncultured marine virus TaxID=186617 RepID=A0A0F7L934_9VIRU|nr:hypothetical protein FAES_3234 [uncultured marine virus]